MSGKRCVNTAGQHKGEKYPPSPSCVVLTQAQHGGEKYPPPLCPPHLNTRSRRFCVVLCCVVSCWVGLGWVGLCCVHGLTVGGLSATGNALNIRNAKQSRAAKLVKNPWVQPVIVQCKDKWQTLLSYIVHITVGFGSSRNGTPKNIRQQKTTQHHTTQHQTTQPNPTQHNPTQHNTTQPNTYPWQLAQFLYPWHRGPRILADIRGIDPGSLRATLPWPLMPHRLEYPLPQWHHSHVPYQCMLP